MLKLKSDHQLCMRCRGYKIMYTTSSGYSTIDSGGKKVDCPCCLGSGQIKKLEAVSSPVVEEVMDFVIKKGRSKRKKEPELDANTEV
jgi:hypothetical protein